MVNPPQPLRILVDTSVRSDANVGKWCTSPSSTKWGSLDVNINVAGVRVVLPKEKGKKEQILALPTISVLAREGHFALLTYSELSFENMFGPRSARATRLDLLAGLDIPSVEPAIDRSYFGGLTFPDGMRSKKLKSFCDVLIKPEFDPSSLPAEFLGQLPMTSRTNILNVKRYREICSSSPPKHYNDLFHLWTGEVNSCEYFLTMETKLPNFYNSHKVSARCIPIRPRELLAEIGIEKLEPLPFAEGSVVDVFSAMDVLRS